MSKNSNEIMSDPAGFMTLPQLDRVFNLMKSRNFRDYALFFVLFKSGRRISELLKLTVKDIDFDNNKILWNILKRRKKFMHWVDEEEETLDVLHTFIHNANLDGKDVVFPLSRQRCHDLFRFYCKNAGIEQIGYKKPHCHILRHSLAIHFIRSGNANIEDLFALKQKLQHSSISSTEGYLQFGSGILKERLKAMPKFLYKRSQKQTDQDKSTKTPPIIANSSMQEPKEQEIQRKTKDQIDGDK